MKINYALILAASLSSGSIVQPLFSADEPAPAPVPVAPAPLPLPSTDSNKLEAPPAPLIPVPAAPAKKNAPTAKKSAAPATKKVVKIKAAEPLKPAAPLTPGPAVARQDNVNIRGQAAINSEVVTRLKKGQQVTVLQEITKKPKQDEPAQWAKVTLPSDTVVWVHSSFIDSATKTVKPKKLNLRSGPGENYSVIGLLEKGAAIKEIESKGEWIKIEAPASAYGFIAAHLLQSAPSAPATPVIASVEPPKAPEIPAAAPTVPVAPVPAPPEIAIVTPTPAPPVATTPPVPVAPLTPPPAPLPVEIATTPAPIPATAPAEPAEEEKEEPLIKRVITREGIVKRSASIQAPTYFVLQTLDNGKTVNYLHATSTNLVLKDFWNQRVVVTGEEQLDERWPNTPVIYVDSLQPVQ